MGENYFRIMYLIVNVFSTYTLYCLLEIFLGKKSCGKNVIFFDYCLYFIVDALMYLGHRPPAAIFIVKIMSVLYLTKDYLVSNKKRIVVTAFICIVLAGIETIVVLVTGYTVLSLTIPTKYSSCFGIVASTMFTYLVMLLLRQLDGLHSGDNDGEFPKFQWFCFLSIPVFSMIIVYTILCQDSFSIRMIILDIAMILLINFLLFYLYDGLIKSSRLKTENVCIQMENKSFRREIEAGNASWESVRSMRHDIRNHMIALRGMMAGEQSKEAVKYIENILNEISPAERIRTGRSEVDSILNLKIEEAAQHKVTFHLEITIPAKFGVAEFDMVTILGNLLDNAITASKLVDGERKIDFIMRYKPGELLIKITNPYSGSLKHDKLGNLETTNEDKKNHGRGIQNVKKAVNNYDGDIFFESDEERKFFSVFIMLYFDD